MCTAMSSAKAASGVSQKPERLLLKSAGTLDLWPFLLGWKCFLCSFMNLGICALNPVCLQFGGTIRCSCKTQQVRSWSRICRDVELQFDLVSCKKNVLARSLRLRFRKKLWHVPFAKSCSVAGEDKCAPSFLMLPLGSKMQSESYVNLSIRPTDCKAQF